MNEKDVDQRLMMALMAMTMVTGFVDAVSYLGLGRVFTANMTGNVVLLGFAVAGAPHLSIARSLASLSAFLVGGVAGGRLGVAMQTVPRKRWLVAVGMSEAVMLVLAAVAAHGYGVGSEMRTSRLYAMIVLTALPMGLRTATVRRLAIADVTTTVLTTTLTGLAADSSLAGGSNVRWGRRLGSVLAMCAGACIGAFCLRFGLALPLLIGAACIFLVTVSYVVAVPPQERVGSETRLPTY